MNILLGFPDGAVVKNPPVMQETQEMWVLSLSWKKKKNLEQEMASCSSILLLNSMDRGTWWAAVHGPQRVGHNWMQSWTFYSWLFAHFPKLSFLEEFPNMAISVHILFFLIFFKLELRNYYSPWKPFFHPQVIKQSEIQHGAQNKHEIIFPRAFLFHSLEGLEYLTRKVVMSGK